MAAAGGTEKDNGSRRRGASPQRGAPRPPKFINRLPKRLPPLLQKHLHASARGRDLRLAGRGFRVDARDSRPNPELARTMLEVGSGSNAAHVTSKQNQKGPRMRNPCIRSLDTVSLDEALSYLDAANGDELGAAYTLAADRNRMDGSVAAPDETEVHHALFLLRRARGLDAPSFDLMRVQLRRRAAA
jgi:hypothetical protein